MARTSNPVMAHSPRMAMVIAHRRLLYARKHTEPGKDYNFWSVSIRDKESGKLIPIGTHSVD
jgi:hypothetical protein